MGSDKWGGVGNVGGSTNSMLRWSIGKSKVC